jgi:hypothetical protein
LRRRRQPVAGTGALSVPIVHLDLEANDADRQLLAVMIWPNDPGMRANYLVKTAVLGKHKTRELARPFREQAFEAVAQNITAKLGLPLSDQEMEALTTRVARRADREIAAILAEIDEQYIEPHGGDDRLAHAPGIDDIVQSAMDDGALKGRACGEILWNIVTLRLHHPDLTASFNHADSIMVSRAKHEGQTLPGQTERWTKMWREHGPVAPLWAAHIFCKSVARERNIPWFFNQWLKQVVSVSLWFTDFAVGFKADKAKPMLLTEDQVIRVNPELGPTKPTIPPFTGQQLIWAQAAY